MFIDIDALASDAAYDFVIAGSGAAGLSAAVFASLTGKKVLVIESTEYVGGTSALSAATTWIPNTPHARKLRTEDSPAKAARFLDGVVGNLSASALREAFLQSGPQAIAALEAYTTVKFRPYATHPDYEQDAEGATLRGRALEPVPYDGRELKQSLDRIRPPIPEFTIFGGMMVDRTDIGHLLNMKRSFGSLKHAARILGHYALDRLNGRKRGTRLAMGNALIGRLLQSLLNLGGDILLNASIAEIQQNARGVSSATITAGKISRRININQALVLAAGGFNRNPDRRAALLHNPVPPHSPAAPGHTGAMQDLAIKLGARLGENSLDTAFWAPVSLRQRTDGSMAVFPHFVLDRSKPGTVCINQAGRRFVNESVSYHLFARAMFEANRQTPCIPCYIVTDAEGLRKYGLGMVRMGTKNLAPFLADGYLISATDIAGLAKILGVDAAGLADTIGKMNRYAETGIDSEFGRGTTDYHRVNGDAAQKPNPTLGRIATPPFYAVKLYPGDIGAATGLVIDEWSRVLDSANQPISGLYACGNEANSIFGGTYPGPGITIGPAITFAYRAVQHALGFR